MKQINTSTTPLIELEHVCFRRGELELLRDINWRIDRGCHWAVLGPNGCGKTTLLRLACGYLWPMGGTIRRLGCELVDLRELRRSIGWVAADLAQQIPQSEPVLHTVVSGKFAQLGIREGDGDQPSLEELRNAAEVLDALGCGALIGRQFGVLSQGERQQVLVARARMVDPLLIVLDEPCAGMDPGARERFLNWLEQIAKQPKGPSLIFVTHHVEEIMPSFESLLVMRNGAIQAAGAKASILTAKLLEELYGVTIQQLELVNHRHWPIWNRKDPG